MTKKSICFIRSGYLLKKYHVGFYKYFYLKNTGVPKQFCYFKNKITNIFANKQKKLNVKEIK